MIVITIGRSHDNDIRINDPYVGRHHCQIVQHNNGSVTVVDMNSTNGTFVNGRRIFGEVKLQPYDSITIGTTNLPWMSYLPPEPPATKSYALPIVLGSVGGVIMTILLALLIFRHGSDMTFDFKGEYPDAVVVNMVNEEGTPYTIEAIEGQVCVWFKNGVPYNTAKQCIKASDGRIVAQDPGNGYYLVKVPADKVNVFLDRIKKESSVDWAYPNMISYSCAVTNYVLDNYYPDTRDSKKKETVPHGRVVEYALREYGSNIELRHFNIGNENGYNMCTSKKLASGCTNSEYFAIDSISRLNNDGPIFINMSYGPGLPRRNKPNGDPETYYWKNATNKEKETYQIWYLESLKKTIKNLRTINGKDYVVVVAAGNEGVKAFGDSIIAFIRNSRSFTEYEKGIMDKHFLLVTAGEQEKKHQNYSNEMESGHYDPWVTKMDISNFKYSDGEKRSGTSFAAPRAAGILSSVANEMDLTGAEVLQLARETTRQNGEISRDALRQKAKDYKMMLSNSDIPSIHDIPTNGGSSAGESSSMGDSPVNTSSSTNSSSSSTSESSSYDGSSTGKPASTSSSSRTSVISAEKAARRLGAAICSGNVSTIQSLTTDDMYEEIVSTVMEVMNEKDEITRAKSKKWYLESAVETISVGNNRVVVRFGSGGSQLDFYMMNENGKWVMYDFAKGGVHVPKNMRKTVRQNLGY